MSNINYQMTELYGMRKDGVKPVTANRDNEEAEAFFEGLKEEGR